MGIDVVDRRARGLPRAGRRRRFGERVLSTREARRVAEAAAPARSLWLHWAAKEAGFKALAGRWEEAEGRPPFRPKEVEVDLGEGPEKPPVESGGGGRPFRVAHPDAVLMGWAGCDGDLVYAVAWMEEELPSVPGKGDMRLEVGWDRLPRKRGRGSNVDLRARFSAEEWDGVHSYPSAVVRLRARAHAARFLDVPEADLEVRTLGGSPGRSPPSLRHRSGLVAVGLSLSHHGRFVGWALRGRGALSPGAGGA